MSDHKKFVVVGVIASSALVISVWSIVMRSLEIKLLNETFNYIQRTNDSLEFAQIVQKFDDD